jgi:hypothetical protein
MLYSAEIRSALSRRPLTSPMICEVLALRTPRKASDEHCPDRGDGLHPLASTRHLARQRFGSNHRLFFHPGCAGSRG